MSDTFFQNPFRSLELRRYPVLKHDMLRAWDAADELILEYLAGNEFGVAPTREVLPLVNSLASDAFPYDSDRAPDSLPSSVGGASTASNLSGETHSKKLSDLRILIVNDHFGALSAALSDFKITSYTDSFVSAQAMRLNSEERVTPICDLSQLSGIYDLVLIQLPKNLSFFEDILAHLSAHLNAHSRVICGAMVKHLAKSSFDLLQKYIGDTTTSLAQKKARLIFCSFEKQAVSSPFPLQVVLDGFNKPFVNHSNLFSREKLDIGTRFFLQHLPRGDFKTILDLGCSNGVVGIAAQKLNPEAQVIFTDESWMAVESARVNYGKQVGPVDLAANVPVFQWMNCYEKPEVTDLDLVLCNPPFHQGNTVGDFIAHQMFVDAFRALRKGGVLRVIGNTHLAYGVKLKKIFGNSRVVATNAKFQVLDGVK